MATPNTPRAPNGASILASHPAYRAYLDCLTLPLGAPPFEIVNGQVVLYYGERRCRWEEEGGLCSVFVGNRNALKNHIFNAHGMEVTPTPVGRPTNQSLISIRRFYNSLMEMAGSTANTPEVVENSLS